MKGGVVCTYFLGKKCDKSCRRDLYAHKKFPKNVPPGFF